MTRSPLSCFHSTLLVLAHPPSPSGMPFQKWNCRTSPLSLLALFDSHTSVLQKLETPTLFPRCMFHKADSRAPEQHNCLIRAPSSPARWHPCYWRDCPRQVLTSLQSDRDADDSEAGAKEKRSPHGPHPLEEEIKVSCPVASLLETDRTQPCGARGCRLWLSGWEVLCDVLASVLTVLGYAGQVT